MNARRRRVCGFIGQTVSLISDQKSTGSCTIGLIVWLTRPQVRRVHSNAVFFLKPLNLPYQIVGIQKRNSKDRAHGRPYRLRIEEIHCVPAHQDAGYAGRLRGPHHGTEISGILYIFKNQQKRISFLLVAQQIFSVIGRHLRNAEHSLGSIRIRNLLHDLGSDDCDVLLRGSADLLCGSAELLLKKLFRHVDFFQKLSRSVLVEALSFYNESLFLSSTFCLFAQGCQPFYSGICR